MAQRQPWMHKSPLFGVSVPGDGPKPAAVMLIGERPGKQEPATGRPFTGAAGMELNRYLKLAGLRREDCYVSNLVKDYRDEDPTEDEILRDLPELLGEIEDVRPDVIVPMGRFAMRHFLGDVDVEQVHGLAFDGSAFGYPGITIYPTFHPAAGLYSGDTIPFIHDDFQGLADVTQRALPVDGVRSPVYRRKTGLDLLDKRLLAAVDSEGWRHAPWSIQFSQAPGEGFIVYNRPGELGEFRGEWNRFWSAGGKLAIHNSLHDLAVLDSMGLQVRSSQFIDTMLLSYLLRLYPQGLKPLAYRLCGMEMASYEEVTGAARESVQREWLSGALAIAEEIAPPELELVWEDKEARWRVKKPHTILQRLTRLQNDLDSGKTKKNGEAIVVAERVGQWDDSAARELVDAIGEVPEPTLQDISPVVAEQYACRDADATIRIAPILMAKVKEMGLEEVSRIDHAILPMINRMQQNGMLINPEHFKELDIQWTREMEEQRDEIEGLVGVRINPSSPPQVAALLFKQLGLDSRKTTKGGAESTQDKVLEALRGDHPVLPMIMNYRELDKMRGSFCRKMVKLAGPDNRVRGNIRVTRTESGRLAMNTPNLMAIPVRMARGKLIRRGFIAAPGNVIGSWDLDQIEMREIADASQDGFLMELFSDPNRDIHSETAARMFDKPLGDVDKKTERYAAKRVGFGIATQITGRGLVDQMELAGATHSDGSRWTELECDNLIELWFGVYPGVRRFIDRTKASVRREGWIRDRWGRIRYLSGVWSTLDRIREEALRQGPSHYIQSGAQGVMKQNMAAIDANLADLPEVMPLLQIHDSLMLEYPEEMHPLVDAIVMDGMEKTVKYTVPITASGEYGYSWGAMDLGED